MKKIKVVLCVIGVFLLFVVGFLLSGGIIDLNSGRNEPEPVLSYVIRTEKERDQEEHVTSRGTPIVEEDYFSDIEMIETTDSSCFSEVGYDRGTGTLKVTFRDSGASYAYDEVPRYVWNKLLEAESMGSYYNQEIKGLYDCVKLD